ncbi:MAG TPA: PDR/VanB family oxidoreductase [Stellaceae bacterium]|jgi:vanillate O-demethylase ferredoxin subunit
MPLPLLVKSITFEAENAVSLDLRPTGPAPLPRFTAGAHIDLSLANGLSRSYSLANPQSETHRYVIGVQRDPASRGGSRFVHEAMRVGQIIEASEPRNNFPLVEDAAETILIAGGIGITPLWCMAQRLQALGRNWRLYYAVRSRRHAAFLDRIAALAPSALQLHADDEHGGQIFDMAPVLAAAGPNAQLYCCGPQTMLAAFEAATAALAPETVHVEYFSPREPVAPAGGFEVALARRGVTLWVAEGQTILAALRLNGIETPHSCLEGVCGTCETTVLEGIPDHRDSVLSERERQSNKTMMICCSGCVGGRLVLDL